MMKTNLLQWHQELIYQIPSLPSLDETKSLSILVKGQAEVRLWTQLQEHPKLQPNIYLKQWNDSVTTGAFSKRQLLCQLSTDITMRCSQKQMENEKKANRHEMKVHRPQNYFVDFKVEKSHPSHSGNGCSNPQNLTMAFSIAVVILRILLLMTALLVPSQERQFINNLIKNIFQIKLFSL